MGFHRGLSSHIGAIGRRSSKEDSEFRRECYKYSVRPPQYGVAWIFLLILTFACPPLGLAIMVWRDRVKRRECHLRLLRAKQLAIASRGRSPGAFGSRPSVGR